MPLSVNSYQSHNYKFLLHRWRKICRKSGLRVQKIGKVDDHACYEIYSPALHNRDIIYISAGIHGDESGSTEGLLLWAESNIDQLSSFPLLIYPCLNPWGLINNSRCDASGVDLNRIWESPDNLLIRHILNRTKRLKFKLVLNLHEDFDGRGIYLYEPSSGGRPSKNAEKIIEAGSFLIPPDSRRMIEGRKAKNGIIRPRPTNPPKDGVPEALYFYLEHKCLTYTFETPSEYDLEFRALAQSTMIQRAISIA